VSQDGPSVASLPECRDLFAASGWDTTIWSWYCDEERDDEPALNLTDEMKVVGGVGYYDHRYPAYDLGYLSRVLPRHDLFKRGNGAYSATWMDYSSLEEINVESRTSPENALARLAIKLFDAGVLLKAA